ncbi:MAG TPA: class I SAM-dependent methyltransferase [Gemmatimonadaceae bacterium]
MNRTMEDLSRAREANPAWYVEEQVAETEGPFRHNLARRRRYVQAVLARELAARGLTRARHVLDLGCGDGNNLVWLAAYAEHLYGSDYNVLRLKRAGARGTGATVFLADILNHAGRDAYFDVIFFNHVIEHIPDDTLALIEVRRLLAPGGVLILGTPNEGSWWWQLAYRRAPHIRASTDHVHFYTAGTIGAKLVEAGFRVTETKHTGWGPPDFVWDQRLRSFRLLESVFEHVGRAILPRQAASLYLVATTA